MTKKHKDLQPLIDYFDMLRGYEQSGHLELQQEKHEAYVTQAAIYTMFPDSGTSEPVSGIVTAKIAQDFPNILHRIHAYAGWKSQQGSDYLTQPFALHVVKDEPPHDLLYTLLLSKKRTRRSAWRKRDHIEIISYTGEDNTKPTR